ncbi:MAP3K12-binding inhibitory protein 1-like [Physella acuta]|uniref:MAP3K12-binding inhibitory protein 1-like n=1 Tax=Physella acuta TaxID=109671 RepID=UPI0027DCCE9D|nr:MAP3K12-binding inhibitory protein 1-like [Physella acuta]XP_059143276.1 MAP3K12-binding inhibitory protein 1-like [Physella acuta]XP_059143277.1 MAP3K12-binding inhibitory protein 1-like [Physella acuta]
MESGDSNIHVCLQSEDVKFDDIQDQTVHPDLIQIKAASEDEVLRRIEAFIRNKRNEVNERNIREFISPILADSENSCARTEAIYIHREGEKSHISLKKVENAYGPQTRVAEDEVYFGNRHTQMLADEQRAEAVEERLANMEAHLNMAKESNNIYARLKALETRISFLEGVSPEYFRNGIPQSQPNIPATTKQEEILFTNTKQVESLSDINNRIHQLKQSLKQKAGFHKYD